jgi:dynactin 5
MATAAATVEEEGYIKTATNSYVSRAAVVENPGKVELKGKSVLQPRTKIRGDLAAIRMGRYCFIGSRTELSPAPLGDGFIPMILRGNVCIGEDCRIEASAIGTNVYIGAHSKVGPRCIVKDNCYIEEDTVLGGDTVIPPFSQVRGNPGKVVDELEPSASLELQELAHACYQDFVSRNPAT